MQVFFKVVLNHLPVQRTWKNSLLWSISIEDGQGQEQAEQRNQGHSDQLYVQGNNDDWNAASR